MKRKSDKLRTFRRQLLLAKLLVGELNRWRAALAREVARLEKKGRRR